MSVSELNTDSLAVSVPRAASMLDVSVVTVWRYLKAGKIPACRIGGRTLIRTADLEKLLDASAVSA